MTIHECFGNLEVWLRGGGVRRVARRELWVLCDSPRSPPGSPGNESFDFRVGHMFLKKLFETSAGLIKSNMLRGKKKKSVNGING